MYKIGYFSIDFDFNDNNYLFKGYTNGLLWNGWETPLFEKEVADIIAKKFTDNYLIIQYNENNDTYNTIDKLDIENNAIIEAKVIQTEEGQKKVYDFSILGWTWDIYNKPLIIE